MKISRLPIVLALAALACAPAALSADPVPTVPTAPASPTAASPKHEEKTDLEKQMDRINHAARALKKQISDASRNESSLALVATIKDASTRALDLVPAKAADLTGADRNKFLADYRAGMRQFITAVGTLSADLQAGDNAAALKDFQHLFALEKQDHKQFRKPENR